MTEYVQVMQRRRGPNTSLFEKQQEKLIEMGFAATDVTIVLESTKGDLEMAQEILLSCKWQSGEIKGIGSFAELEEQIPEFAEQVKLGQFSIGE